MEVASDTHPGDDKQGTKTPKRSRSGSTAGKSDRPCPKPGCGGQLTVRKGRHGRFLGCTNYPRCKHTENLV